MLQLHMRHPHALAAAGFAILLGLAGCGSSDVQRTFGFTRDAPDEFQVTTRAPLSMPPDYTLRPPRPGETRPQEMTASRAAESALVPQAALTPGPAAPGAPGGSVTSGEQALVAAAGAPAPANIRSTVNADAAQDTQNQSFTDRLMFWRTAAARRRCRSIRRRRPSGYAPTRRSGRTSTPARRRSSRTSRRASSTGSSAGSSPGADGGR